MAPHFLPCLGNLTGGACIHAARRTAALPEPVLTPLLDEEKPDELAVGPPSRLTAGVMDGGMKDGTYLPDALGPCPATADMHSSMLALSSS